MGKYEGLAKDIIKNVGGKENINNERLVIVLFNRYKGLVKYWLTFNEINMLLHLPFTGAGILIEDGENKDQLLFSAAHHQLIASSLATKIAHEVDSEIQVGCMLAAVNTYHNIPNPNDIWRSMEKIGRIIYLLMSNQEDIILVMH